MNSRETTWAKPSLILPQEFSAAGALRGKKKLERCRPKPHDLLQRIPTHARRLAALEKQTPRPNEGRTSVYSTRLSLDLARNRSRKGEPFARLRGMSNVEWLVDPKPGAYASA